MSDRPSVQLRDAPAGCGKNLNAGLCSELSHGNKRVQTFHDDFELHNNLEVYTYKIHFSDCHDFNFARVSEIELQPALTSAILSLGE